MLLVFCRYYRFVTYVFLYVFFCKQKTAYEMRISDWSSDVCSSDLGHRPDQGFLAHHASLTSWMYARSSWTIAPKCGSKVVSSVRGRGMSMTRLWMIRPGRLLKIGRAHV